MSKQKTKSAAFAEVVRLRRHVSMVVLVSATSATLWAQIPEHAQWEITFAQVEAAAGLSDLRTAGPETYEARVMQRAWSAVSPLPFLRIVRTGGTLRVQLFQFWAPKYMAAVHRPQGSDIVCRDGICVRPIVLSEQQNWEETLGSLAHQDACPKHPDDVAIFCADCPHIWIKTKADGKYRERSCNIPGPETPAGALMLLMNTAATAAR
jgi:hypothetical protein